MKSLIDRARRGRAPPQMPVRKKNGTSIRSKKTTNSARSCASSAPSTAVSREREMEEEELAAGSRSRSAAQTVHARPQRRAVSRIEEEVQPVDAELVVDAELGDPQVVGDVLQPAAPLSKSASDDDGVGEREQRAGERDGAHERGGSSRPTNAARERAGRGRSRGGWSRLQEEVDGDGDHAEDHQRGVGAQEAGLRRAHRGASRRARRRVVPPMMPAVDEHALETDCAKRADPPRRAGRTSRSIELVEVPLVDEQRVERLEALRGCARRCPGAAPR